MKKSRLARNGSVLIVVLGMLVIISLLGTTFATLQQLDRTISKNYVDDVRAKLAAQSGVEYAISQIREMMAQGFFSTGSGSQAHIYWGADTGELGTDPALQQVALEQAKNPSWAFEDENPQNPNDSQVTPKLLKVKLPNGTISQVGFSGFHSTGTYAAYGDIYTLRVVDSSGMIYVNDGIYQYKYENDIGDGSGQHSSVTANLRRILNNLGQHPDVNIPGLGNKIIKTRGDGYTSKYDLRRAVGYDEMQFNKFKDYVTTYAWVDKNVVNPVPLSGKVYPSDYPIDYFRGGGVGGPRLRRGRGYNSQGNQLFSAEPLQWYQPGNVNPNHNGIYAHDELFPSYVEVVWRAPVNINSAPEAVLSSLIAGVSGFFSIERRRFSPYMGSPDSFTYSGGAFMGYPCTFTIPQKYYTWEYVQHTFSAEDSEGDEIGNLYRTAEFVLPGGTSTGSVSAKTVAQHIIACRSRIAFGGIDYGNLPTLGGPFKSWSHFYNFLDNLVEEGVIKDDRSSIFYDYRPASASNWTKIQSSSSAVMKFAAYAMADALKANFNPNMILNETNPDRNMFLRVDKTDLIVNSTEFCFTPMGYYEIESLGRVLRPTEIGVTALTSAGNVIVAEKKILVSVKLYDAYRETSQRHFYAAELDGSPQTGLKPRQSDPETNNNLSLEIGPEVDNGPLVYGDNWAGASFRYNPTWDGYAGYPVGQSQMQTGWGYEYGGYIALPTLGGVKGNMNDFKEPGTLEETPQGGSQFGSVIHSHFSWDFKAHHHASASALGNDWFRDELGSNYRYANSYIDQIPYSKPPKVERAMNHEDRGENAFSPYCPTYGMRYRLARSFRLPMTQPGGGTTSGLPSSINTMKKFAPSDLRIDGAYSERHSGIAYWMDQGVSWNEQGGTMAVWLKPSFYPEHSGKQRKVFGMSRWHSKNYNHRNPGLWDVFYFPAHDKLPDITSQTESMSTDYIGSPASHGADFPVEAMGGKGIWPFKPMSFGSAWAANCYDGALADMYDEGPWLEEENYCTTPTLNHRLHPSESNKPNFLDKGRWTHLIFRWHTESGASVVYTNEHWQRLYVNGQFLSGTQQRHAGTIYDSSYRTRWFTIQSFSDSSTNKWRTNTIRLGEVSSHGFGTFNRNFSADMTFDEFYVWKSNGSSQLNNAKQLWLRGRYYKPQWGNYEDAGFVSRSIDLDKAAPLRYLPPPSTTANPPNSSGGSSSGSTSTTPPGTPKRRLLGISWTWFAEDYIKNVPLQWDFSNPSAPAKLWQTDDGTFNGTPVPAVRMFVMADGKTFPDNPDGFKNDGFSQILDPNGNPYEMTDATDIRYRIMFQIKGVDFGSVLLGTPYFEDVTIFYDQGEIEILLYAVINTT